MFLPLCGIIFVLLWSQGWNKRQGGTDSLVTPFVAFHFRSAKLVLGRTFHARFSLLGAKMQAWQYIVFWYKRGENDRRRPNFKGGRGSNLVPTREKLDSIFRISFVSATVSLHLSQSIDVCFLYLFEAPAVTNLHSYPRSAKNSFQRYVSDFPSKILTTCLLKMMLLNVRSFAKVHLFLSEYNAIKNGRLLFMKMSFQLKA